MSDDKDDLNGFDGLGKTNDDGMHFSEEELEAAMAGFEKEFQDEEVAQQNDAPAQVPFDQPDETVNSDASSDESQDGLQSKEATRYCPKPRTRCHSTTSCRDCWATVRKSR